MLVLVCRTGPLLMCFDFFFFFFQAEDGIRDKLVTGVQTCALPISGGPHLGSAPRGRSPVPLGGAGVRAAQRGRRAHGDGPGRGGRGARHPRGGRRWHRAGPRIGGDRRYADGGGAARGCGRGVPPGTDRRPDRERARGAGSDRAMSRGYLLVRVDGKAYGLPLARVVERSEEHTSELQSLAYLVCRLLLEK